MTGALRNERLEATGKKQRMYVYIYIYIYIEEQRTIFIKKNLGFYEYCALAQEICGCWDDFVGSYGSEEMFLGRCQIFRLGPC